MGKLTQLFNEIHLLIEKHEQIYREKGENYNLFQVINMTSDETKVHSAMIADLLNPKGLHQMGDIFLKLFINKLKQQLKLDKDFEFSNPTVECEKHIGAISENKDAGGRIDIYISDKNHHIAIENKIYATDQENQLLRYYNYLEPNPGGNKVLLYLSLYGDVSDIEKTTGNNQIKDGKDFFTISYSEFILNWLEECRVKAIDKPLIREGITHYRNLIRILTHQMENEKNELIELIKENPKYICYLPKYKDAIKEVEIGLYIDFWIKLEKAIENHGYTVEKKSFDGYKYALDNNYVRKYHESNNCKYQSIEFEIVKSDKYRLMYSVQVDWHTYGGALIRDNSNKVIPAKDAKVIDDPKLKGIISQIDEMILDSKKGYRASSNWLFWKYTEPSINFRDLNDGNSACRLSRMDETIDSITKGVFGDIKMIINNK